MFNNPKKYAIILDREKWDEVILHFSDSDIYHTFDYTQINLKSNEKAIMFYYEESQIKIAVSLIIRMIEGSTYCDASTVYGYGGPLIKGKLSNEIIHNFQNSFQEYLKELKIISVFGRLHPFIDKQNLLLENMGILENKGEVVFIDLNESEQQITEGYQKRHHTQIKKYKKECSLFISNTEASVDEFMSIYNENMDRVGANKNYYFERDYYLKILNSEKIKADFIFVRENLTDTIIGAGILFKSKVYSQYHLSGARESGLHLSPAKLLIDEMWRISKREGYQYFNLGGGLGAQQDSLFRFKSLFSNHRKTFFVWKYIVDKEAYKALVHSKSKIEKPEFFPLYRG